jgi:hypothetical protein
MRASFAARGGRALVAELADVYTAAAVTERGSSG